MTATRRRRGEDGISFEHRGPCTDPQRHRHCPGLWRGELTLGYTGDGKRTRRKVSGKTKAAVVDKLRDLHLQLDKGITPKAGYTHYTVRQATSDWLAHGLEGRSSKTVTKNQNVLEPILAVIGARKLRDLSADDVWGARRHGGQVFHRGREHGAPGTQAGHPARRSKRPRRPQRREPGRHPQRPARPAIQIPDPRPGDRGHHRRPHPAGDGTAPRPQRRPPARRADARLHHAEPAGWAPHRRSQSPALGPRRPRRRPRRQPAHPPHVAVWRSVRAHGDTKTERSRRTLALPATAVQALRAWQDRQAAERADAGDDWQDTGLVFTTHNGAALDAANVRKMFKRICTEAGTGDGWTPRELRTTFVSLMSHQGVAIEEIARLVGHASTRTTEIVYRRELRPVITTGAQIMDHLFSRT